jgi:hypothetical protein
MKINSISFVRVLREFADRIWRANDPIEMFVAEPIFEDTGTGYKIKNLFIKPTNGPQLDILPLVSWVGYRMCPSFSRGCRTNSTIVEADRGTLTNGFTQVITKMVMPGEPGYNSSSAKPVIDIKKVDTSGMSERDAEHVRQESQRKIVPTGKIHHPNAINEFSPRVHTHALLLDGELKIDIEQLPQKILVIKTQKPTTYIMMGGTA